MSIFKQPSHWERGSRGLGSYSPLLMWKKARYLHLVRPDMAETQSRTSNRVLVQLPFPVARAGAKIGPLPRHIPELDGLRAVAILMVLAFHLNFERFSLGWTGVTLFFALSGFLITGLLLDAKGRPHYFRNFYARRALRIFPIYYLSLSVITVIALAGGQKVTDLPYYLLYAQNYLLGATNFTPQFPDMFNHSWSLAVEEQFYLLWPLAVLLLSRRRLLGLLALLFSLGLFSRAVILFTLNTPTLMDTPLPTQLEPLAVGAALALLARSRISAGLLAKLGVVLALISGVVIFSLVQATGLLAFWHPQYWANQVRNLPLMTLIALFWGGVLTYAVFGKSPFSSLLRLAPLRHVGKVSYGMYLYHFPIFFAIDYRLPALLPHAPEQLLNVATVGAKLLLTYLLALLSWKLVESPLLRLKDRFV